MPGKIFINYRRDDVPGDARGVRDALAARFGKSSVFMDVDNLIMGQRFDIELNKALDQCELFLAIIGPRWLDLFKARSVSRERDYVRAEIAEAIKRRIPVVPIRVGREGSMPRLPEPEDLPADIRELVLYQKHDVAHERFGRDMEELNRAIAALRKPTFGTRGYAGARSMIGGAAAVLALLLGAGSYYAGWVKPEAPVQQSVASVPVTAETERKRIADLQVEIERRDAALAKAEVERLRIENNAARLRETDARRKADEAERQRLAAAKADESRRRAEAETKRADQQSRVQWTATAESKATDGKDKRPAGPCIHVEGKGKSVPITVGAILCNADRTSQARVEEITDYSVVYSVNGSSSTCRRTEICTFSWRDAPLFKFGGANSDSSGKRAFIEIQ